MSDIHNDISNLEIEKRYGTLASKLREVYTKKRIPLRGVFELTPYCTLDCKMCYVHSSSGQYSGRVLVGDEWLQVMDEAIDMGMLYAVLTGGECLLHPDFRNIYQYLKSRGVFIDIFSNGTLLDEEYVSWLQVRRPHRIKISIYGSSPEEYEQVAGSADAFYKVDRALELLEKAQIAVDLSLTISKYNFKNLNHILKYLESKAYGRLAMDCEMSVPRDETGKTYADISLNFEEQWEVWSTFWRWKNKAAKKVRICEDDFGETEKILDEDTRKKYLSGGVPCTAGKSAFFISYDGQMQPCVQFPLIKTYPLSEGFTSSWRTVNQSVWEYERSEECKECQYLGTCRFCPGNYLLEKDHLGNLPCDKKMRMMPYVIRKIQEGHENEESI